MADENVSLSDDEIIAQAVANNKSGGNGTQNEEESSENSEEEEAEDDGTIDLENNEQGKDDDQEAEGDDDAQAAAKSKGKDDEVLDIESEVELTSDFKTVAGKLFGVELTEETPVAFEKAFETAKEKFIAEGYEKGKSENVRAGLADLPPTAHFLVDAMKGPEALTLDELLGITSKYDHLLHRPAAEIRLEFLQLPAGGSLTPEEAQIKVDKEIADGTLETEVKVINATVKNAIVKEQQALAGKKAAAFQQYEADKLAEDKADSDKLKSIIDARTTYNGKPLGPNIKNIIKQRIDSGEYKELFLKNYQKVADAIYHLELADRFIKSEVKEAASTASKGATDKVKQKLHNIPVKRSAQQRSAKMNDNASGGKGFQSWDKFTEEGISVKHQNG